MKFFSLVTFALVANVSAVELHNQAHAKGLKAPHQVRALAQGKEDLTGINWGNVACNARGAAGAAARVHSCISMLNWPTARDASDNLRISLDL